MRTRLLILALAIAGRSAHSQACPKQDPGAAVTPSQVRVLHGQLVYHNGLRQWYELKLDKPVCGETSLELMVVDSRPGRKTNWPTLERFRGCHVKSSGALDVGGTGYFSTDMFQSVHSLSPDAPCRPKPLFPDYSHLKPAPQVRSYRVDMTLNYRPGDHPIRFRVSAGGHELRPWQAYASYYLTRLFMLYGSCANGFVVDKVYGAPETHPGHFDEPRTPSDRATFDESAVREGTLDLQLGYTCLRSR